MLAAGVDDVDAVAVVGGVVHVVVVEPLGLDEAAGNDDWSFSPLCQKRECGYISTSTGTISPGCMRSSFSWECTGWKSLAYLGRGRGGCSGGTPTRRGRGAHDADGT